MVSTSYMEGSALTGFSAMQGSTSFSVRRAGTLSTLALMTIEPKVARAQI
jgi:hypothetical protein